MRTDAIRETPARKDRGFTLVELLTVLVIIGVLASLAAPSYNSFIARQRIKTVSFDLITMLTFTRSEAIKRNESVSALPVSNDWSKGWRVQTAGGTILRQQQDDMRGISVICKQGGSAITCDTLTYNLSGRLAGTARQAIQLSSADADTRCIGIDLSGRPNSKKGECI